VNALRRTVLGRHPGRLVVTAFVVVIALGTALLRLPVAWEPGQQVSLVDALFTATSAVCVTGLVTLDTGTSWSLFGELVILFLIQLGGLGIMTIASIATLLVFRKLRISSGLLVGAETGVVDRGQLKPVLRAIVAFTFITEAVVAAILTVRFWAEGTWGFASAAYLGVFHAVSAFNNAGFSNLDGGLQRFVGDPFINLVVPLAFILGGIGFPVVAELRGNPRRPRRWSLHTKLTLSATGLLLAFGMAAILAMEWTNPTSLGGLGGPQKVLTAFFQSATPRTAGFDTVPMADLRLATLLLIVLFMVVGGSSGSTAGGIKTSTFAVLLWTSKAELRGDDEVTAFGRRIPAALQRQALAIVIVGVGVIGTALFTLALLMPDGTPLLDLLFETVSAFGTVGLSTGITPELTGPAKGLVCALMLFGRLGPITLGSALLFRRSRRRFGYPEERLMIG
jgi:trk system potassium uptake protein